MASIVNRNIPNEAIPIHFEMRDDSEPIIQFKKGFCTCFKENYVQNEIPTSRIKKETRVFIESPSFFPSCFPET